MQLLENKNERYNEKLKYKTEMKKTITNGRIINTLVSTRRVREVNWYPFRGKLWLHRLYQSRVSRDREEREKGDESDVLICAFTWDHAEESLPLPRYERYKGGCYNEVAVYQSSIKDQHLRKYIKKPGWKSFFMTPWQTIYFWGGSKGAETYWQFAVLSRVVVMRTNASRKLQVTLSFSIHTSIFSAFQYSQDSNINFDEPQLKTQEASPVTCDKRSSIALYHHSF